MDLSYSGNYFRNNGDSLSEIIKRIQQNDLSIAYVIWSGLGIVVVSIIGFFYFKETVNFAKIVCIVLVIIGVVGLRWVGISDGVSN